MLQSMVQQDCNMKKFGIVPHQFYKCLKLLKIDRTVWVESWVNVQYPQHETGKNAAAMLQHLRHKLLHRRCLPHFRDRDRANLDYVAFSKGSEANR
jgi:hypothetical protein